ncbi:MAG: GNAT family N-acetyltransferase [Myxococcales bacterium]|nr:MAG: GNAT family N-acetyltransferase [Myxococcales bacterium]
MSEGEYRCERAGPAHTEALLALLESAGSGCYCNYWHFVGDKNAWLERCYVRPEDNRVALAERLRGDELCGVVARASSGALCGWMKVTRAAEVARLYEQRVYRSLPCFGAEPGARADVYTIACAYVAEDERGRGVAKALLSEAIVAARAAGASALEAFPRGGQLEAERLRADEVWMGPEALFLAAGFARVSDFRPYPVLRLHLR